MTILPHSPPEIQTSHTTAPDSPRDRAERAVRDDLAAHAAYMHCRGRPAIEILLALHHRSRLLAQAHGYRMRGCLPIVRQLPGLAEWDPDAEAKQVEMQFRRRALAVADWLRRHAGESAAERAVRCVEQLFTEGGRATP